MNHLRRRLPRLAGPALLLLASCSTPSAFLENRQVLETADKNIAAGSPDAATGPLEQLIIKTNLEADRYALQRYFAAFLLARARLEAAAVAKGNDWLHPLVATSYYLNFAEEWRKTAAGAPAADEAGEKALPEGLASGGIARAEAYLQLAWLVLCGRTGFHAEMGDVVQQEPQLQSVDTTEALGNSVGVSARLMPWVMWSLFEFQRLRNEPLAYTFGIRARELGRKVPDAFPSTRSDEIVDWIQHGSKFVFKSTAGIPFDPGADVCSQTGEPNIKFHAEPRQ